VREFLFVHPKIGRAKIDKLLIIQTVTAKILQRIDSFSPFPRKIPKVIFHFLLFLSTKEAKRQGQVNVALCFPKKC
jgi:hypothetical protein